MMHKINSVDAKYICQYSDEYLLFGFIPDDKQIPMENIISCAADGAPMMMGKINWLKDDNPQMLLVHCVIYRHNLVSKKFPLF